jgi:hypothetical protein
MLICKNSKLEKIAQKTRSIKLAGTPACRKSDSCLNIKFYKTHVLIY